MEQFKHQIIMLEIDLESAKSNLEIDFDSACISIEDVLYRAKELYLQMKNYEGEEK